MWIVLFAPLVLAAATLGMASVEARFHRLTGRHHRGRHRVRWFHLSGRRAGRRPRSRTHPIPEALPVWLDAQLARGEDPPLAVVPHPHAPLLGDHAPPAGDQPDADPARAPAPPTVDAAGPTLRLVVAAEQSALPLVRGEVRDWLRLLDWPPPQLVDTVLAIDEATTNAFTHAYPADAPALVDVAITPHPGPRLHITVTDHGRWRPPPPSAAHHRRGIPLMHACMDTVRIHGSDQGTRVELETTATSA